MVKLVVLSLVDVMGLVAVDVMELLMKLVALVLAMLVLVPVLDEVTVVPATFTVVTVAATILISGSSMAVESQPRSRP